MHNPGPFDGADLAAGPLLIDPRTAAAYGHEHGRRRRRPIPRGNFMGSAVFSAYLIAYAEGLDAEQAILFGF